MPLTPDDDKRRSHICCIASHTMLSHTNTHNALKTKEAYAVKHFFDYKVHYLKKKKVIKWFN